MEKNISVLLVILVGIAFLGQWWLSDTVISFMAKNAGESPLDTALILALKTMEEGLKYERLAEVAVGYKATNDEKKFDSLLKIISYNKDNAILGNAARIFIKNGLIDDGLTVSKKITDDTYKDDIYKSIADKYVELFQLDKALEYTRQIQDLFKKDQALMGVALGYGMLNKFDQALLIKDEIREFNLKEQTLFAITDRAIKSGDLNLGQQLLASITNVAYQNQLLMTLADSYLLLGDLTKSMEMLRKVPDSSLKNAGFKNLVTYHIERGNINAALDLVKEITDQTMKGNLMAQISDAMISAGNLTQVLNLLRNFNEVNIIGMIQASLVKGYLELGNTFMANQILRQIQDTQSLAVAVGNMVKVHLNNNDLESAINLARTITVAEERNRILYDLALSLVSQGNITRAMDLVLSLQNDALRMDFLLILIKSGSYVDSQIRETMKIVVDIADKIQPGLGVKLLKDVNLWAIDIQRYELALYLTTMLPSTMDKIEMLIPLGISLWQNRMTLGTTEKDLLKLMLSEAI